ncbi:MAG: glycerate kinase type-2 family protein [Candidatus Odinarchaeia archaeon]
MYHFIKNREQILENAYDEENRECRRIILDLIEEALKSADPKLAVKNNLTLRGSLLKVKNIKFNLDNFDHIFVVGAGKASGYMAVAAEEILGDKISSGFVNILRGTKDRFKTERIQLNEADHPIPSEAGVQGARKIFEIAKKAGENDLLLCLLSGGGSALMPLPAPPVSLEDMKEITNLLLKSGANIVEINAVRKHISKISGGQLAAAAYPATVLSLIISDVVGDPLDVICSGATAPDESTFSDAVKVLKKYNIWDKCPKSIKERITKGVNGDVPETPKKDDIIFSKVYNVIIASNRIAVEAVRKKAIEKKFNTLLLSTFIEGEASSIGTVLGGIAKEIEKYNDPIKKPAVVVSGGETTVTLTGRGNGGRNQGVALAAAFKIKGVKNAVFTSFGTDGIDGKSDAAGAIVDDYTIVRSEKLGLDPMYYLKENAEYHFFSKLGDAIITGPTGTNVNDVMILLIR